MIFSEQSRAFRTTTKRQIRALLSMTFNILMNINGPPKTAESFLLPHLPCPKNVLASLFNNSLQIRFSYLPGRVRHTTVFVEKNSINRTEVTLNMYR